ncbi:glycosyltransferase family 2 protein [bacterium]|nr:glycosyltransferase family 2 protein [bacterium]
MKTGVIIPAYNEEAHLGAVLLKVKQFIPRDHVCVIDDGSSDQTADAASAESVRCIRFEVNRGKGEALKAGFAWAAENGMEAVITLDGDGQHDPDLIPEFIQIMQNERCDAVLGTRRFRPGEMPFDRILSNRLSSWMVSRAAGKNIPDTQCGYRMFRMSVLKNLNLTGSLYELESEMLIRLGRRKAAFRFCMVPTTYAGAASSIRRWRDIGRFLRMWLKLIFTRKENL